MAGKELRAYFHSPIAYVVMTIWTAMTGFAFYLHLWVYTNEIFRMQMMGGMGAPPISLNDVIIRPMLEGFLLVVLLFLTPVITMRLFAEEKRSGSIELLLTSPVTDLEIILGKYAGAFLLLNTVPQNPSIGSIATDLINSLSSSAAKRRGGVRTGGAPGRCPSE